MADATGDRIVRLFEEAERGDKRARDALFAALYDELRRLAHAHLHRHGGQLTLSATTLLHEAYLDIAQRTNLTFPSRGHFLSLRVARHARPDHRLRAARARGEAWRRADLRSVA
jgi:ECF sigma factor